MAEEEIWKDIKGYEGRYKISNRGNVLSTGNYLNGRKHKERLVKTRKNKYGYITVCLYTRQVGRTCMLHRLIADAFIDNPMHKPFIDHINTIKDDNRIENLRWVTAKENCNNPLSLKHIKESSKLVSNRIEVRKERSERMRRINDIVVEKRRKKVLQFDLNGNFIREHKSVRYAAKSVNGHPHYITFVCRGEWKQYKGFVWKYKEV